MAKMFSMDDMYAMMQAMKGGGKGGKDYGKSSWGGNDNGGGGGKSFFPSGNGGGGKGKGGGKGGAGKGNGKSWGGDGGGGKGFGKSGGKGKVQKKMKKGGAPVNSDGAVAYKSLLNDAYMAHHKTTVEKGTITYTTEGTPDEGFSSSVAGEQFASEYNGIGATKKRAENEAAEAALKAEFPNFPRGGKAKKATAKAKSACQIKGKKGAAKANAATNKSCFKGMLSMAYQKMYKTPMTKETIVYTSEGTDEDGFQAVVTIELSADVYRGSGASQKEAEEAAAEAAIKAEFPDAHQAKSSKQKQGGKAQKLGKTQKAATQGKKVKVKQTIAKKSKVGQYSARSDGTICYKSVLNGAYMDKNRCSLEKGAMNYSSVRNEIGKGDGYTVTLSCDGFTQTYVGKGKTGKQAGDVAAKKALQREFPSYTFSKAEGGQGKSSGSKTELMNGVGVIVGRPLTKGDIEFIVAEDGGSHTATIIFHCLGDKKIAGGAESEKKLAEGNAATKALKFYAKQIEIKKNALDAKKAEKQAERQATRTA